MIKAVSPSRTYVAVCSNSNFEGYYFKKFKLPESEMPLANDTEAASWYFLNRLDAFSCIDGCITFEDYSNINDVSQEQIPSVEV